MSQTVREIAERTTEDFESWWASDGRFIDPDTSDVDWFDKRKELAALAFIEARKPAPLSEMGQRAIGKSRERLAHMLASTEHRESLDGLGRRIKELTEVIADLREQLQAATMRAEAAEGDTRMMDELQAKCGALLMEVATVNKEREENERWETGFRNIVTALVGPRVPFEISDIVEAVKSIQQLADERGREVERMKAEVKTERERSALLERTGRFLPPADPDPIEEAQWEIIADLHAQLQTAGTVCIVCNGIIPRGWRCWTCRRTGPINDALATPAATPPAKPSFRQTLKAHGIPPLSEERQAENLRAEFGIGPTPPAHAYTSTACHHGLHDRCRNNCKFCGTPCLCACGHVDTSAEFHITPEEAIEYATDEEIGEIPRPNISPAQEHPDTAASFMFLNPLDQSPMIARTFEATRQIALEYLGREDWEGEPVSRLGIYRVEKVGEVTAPEAQNAKR